MNKGRWASIRLVVRRSVCSAVDVSVILVSLPWSAITRLNLRRRPKQVYWSREQFGKIGRHALSREDFGQRQPKSDWYSRGVGHMGRRKYKSHLAVRPVEVPRTLRDYSSGSPEFEG
jgi:hypothetical protein